MKSYKLAPIVLFVYNRPRQTDMTFGSLSKATLAKESEVIVFCDGPKENASELSLNNISSVREIVRKQDWARNMQIVYRKRNFGLAENIIKGVGDVLGKYGKAIILEDDLLVSKGFLAYMNKSLEKYKNSYEVKQVSGFLMPLNLPRKNSSFFMPQTNTIGWATWNRAWEEIDFYPIDYKEKFLDTQLKREFDLGGIYDYSGMLAKQMESKNYGSWAIRYWWSVYKSKGLVLYPDYSLIQHNDFNSTGTHFSDYSHLDEEDWDDSYTVDNLPNVFEVNEEYFSRHKTYLRASKRITIKKILRRIRLFARRKLSGGE